MKTWQRQLLERALAEAGREELAEYSGAAGEEVVFSPGFREKIMSIQFDGSSPCSRSCIKKTLKLLLVAALFAAVVMSVSASRDSILRPVIDLENTTFTISFDLDDKKPAENDGFTAGYIPGGFTQSDAGTNGNGNYKYITWKNESGDCEIEIRRITDSSCCFLISTSDGTISKLKVGDRTVSKIMNKHGDAYFWVEKDSFFLVSAAGVPYDELVRVINGVSPCTTPKQ